MENDTTPPAGMSPGAALAAWEKRGGPNFRRDRLVTLAILAMITTTAAIVAIIMMMPLKTITPYIIETDGSGETVAIGAAREGFNPSEAQIIYSISRWVESLWGIDRVLVKHNLESAYTMTRGKAADVFRQHVASYRPIERSVSDLSLSASVQVKAVNFLPNDSNTGLVRFEVTERRKDTAPVVRTYMMTLHWVIIPPTTIEEIQVNPIGFFVTDFSWTQEAEHEAQQ